MKTLPGLTKCGLFLIAAFGLTAGQCDQKHDVLFVPNYEKADMIILPGTEITAEDAAHLRKILAASNQYFYTIQPYENGSPQAAFGKLPLPTDFKCRTDKEEFEGFTPGTSRKFNFSRWTRVVGLDGQSRRCLGKISRLLPQGTRSTKSSQDLVDAVKPILQKYQSQ
jgi:hypothetical protein